MDFELSPEQKRLVGLAGDLGRERFAKRAIRHDRDATFPFENYADLRAAGLLKLCVPKEYGGLGAEYQTYMLVGAEIGRHCGATALTFNMHTCAMLWNAQMIRDFPLTAEQRAEHDRLKVRHFRRVVEQGLVYSQPFSESGEAWMAKPFATSARPVDGGYLLNGRKIFASLSGACDYYGIVCTEVKGRDPSFDDTLYLAVSKDTPGLEIVGEWDPLGMRATVSRTLVLKDAFVPHAEAIMPAGVYFMGAKIWPHMYMTLTPAYMGIAQAAYDFTIAYLRGEVEGMPPIRRRQYATKRIGVAEMYVKLQQTWAMFLRAITEARGGPSKDEVMRMFATQYTVMENANDICRLAIRTCGGQSMLKQLPLERHYRDSRCGSLMLPFTAEICLDNIGLQALYQEGETDEDPVKPPPRERAGAPASE